MSAATAVPGEPGPRQNAAFYADSVAAFLRASDDEVYAPLAGPHGYQPVEKVLRTLFHG